MCDNSRVNQRRRAKKPKIELRLPARDEKKRKTKQKPVRTFFFLSKKFIENSHDKTNTAQTKSNVPWCSRTVADNSKFKSKNDLEPQGNTGTISHPIHKFFRLLLNGMTAVVNPQSFFLQLNSLQPAHGGSSSDSSESSITSNSDSDSDDSSPRITAPGPSPSLSMSTSAPEAGESP